MQQLIQDLLSYARVDSRGGEPQAVDLERLVNEVASDLEVVIKNSQATLEIDSLPVVMGEPTQFRQLFQNLVGNALKFQVDGRKPLVAIKCTDVDITSSSDLGLAPGAYHRVSVKDNGIGFRPEFASKIFEVFERLHSRSEYSGTGIGLAICKKIARKHGGDIIATGQEGEGAEFTIFLPVQAELEALNLAHENQG